MAGLIGAANSRIHYPGVQHHCDSMLAVPRPIRMTDFPQRTYDVAQSCQVHRRYLQGILWGGVALGKATRPHSGAVPFNFGDGCKVQAAEVRQQVWHGAAVRRHLRHRVAM